MANGQFKYYGLNEVGEVDSVHIYIQHTMGVLNKVVGSDVLIALPRRCGVYPRGERLGSMVLVVRRVVGHDRVRPLVVVVRRGAGGGVVVVVGVPVVLVGVAVHRAVASGTRGPRTPAEGVE